jgi:hypothetical protein
VSSPTVRHLEQHIAARKRALQRHLHAIPALPKGHPARAAHRTQADRLVTEVSAIRATVDFQKTPEVLSGEIERQQVRVEYLVMALKKARGAKKLQLTRVLHQENLRLKEMLAAARQKAILPPTLAEERAAASELPSVALLPDAPAAATVAAAAAAQTPVPAQHQHLFPDDPRDPYIASNRSHERFWSRIPGMDDAFSGVDDADDTPWYKNPLVGLAVGVAAGWYLAKKV